MLSEDESNTTTSSLHPRSVEEGESWWSHLTNVDVIPLLPKPSLGETQYIQVSLHNHIVHLQGLVDSRPGVPHTMMMCVAFLGRGAELQVGESGGDEGLLTTGGEPTVNGRQGLQPAET